MSEDQEVVRFGEADFRTLPIHYLSQYMKDNRSIDTVYGIRRETDGMFLIDDSPLSVY